MLNGQVIIKIKTPAAGGGSRRHKRKASREGKAFHTEARGEKAL